jgi:hypothetical protein
MMKRKLSTAVIAIFGLSMMGLQGCFNSSPNPGPYYGGGSNGYYGGAPAYRGPAYGGGNGYYGGAPAYRGGPAYGGGGATVGSCNPRKGVCMVCDNEGHNCHPVRS